MARQRLADQSQCADVDLLRRIVARRGVLEPAIAAELAHQLAAGGIDIAVIDMRAMLRGPGFQPLGQRAVTLLEKRPMQETAVEHRSISGELRFLFGDKGLIGAAEILRLHADRLRERLRLDRRRRAASRIPDAAWSSSLPCANVGPLGELLRNRHRIRFEFIGADNAIEKAPALALLRCHDAAGIEQLRRAAVADDARQQSAGAHVAAGKARRG